MLANALTLQKKLRRRRRSARRSSVFGNALGNAAVAGIQQRQANRANQQRPDLMQSWAAEDEQQRQQMIAAEEQSRLPSWMGNQGSIYDASVGARQLDDIVLGGDTSSRSFSGVRVTPLPPDAVTTWSPLPGETWADSGLFTTLSGKPRLESALTEHGRAFDSFRENGRAYYDQFRGSVAGDLFANAATIANNGGWSILQGAQSVLDIVTDGQSTSETLSGIYQAARHPVQTYDSAVMAMSDFYDKPLNEQMLTIGSGSVSMLGGVVGEMALMRGAASASRAAALGDVPQGAALLRAVPTLADKAAVFEPLGIMQNPLSFEEGRRLVVDLQRSGLSKEQALARAQDLYQSGSTVPFATPIDQTDHLIKLVPQGGRVPNGSSYWMTESEYRLLQADPTNVPGRLGLPARQFSESYDVYVTRPIDSGAVVYQSTIAPTRQGSYLQPGGLRQTLVINPQMFTPPARVGIFKW